MIKFDSFTLKLFEQEVREYFSGARIRKIQQIGAHELVFFMRNQSENRKFYINFHPDFHHICFINEETEKRLRLTVPKSAPMFCMLLRKYIMNAKITKINVPSGERIFEIYFEYSDELNDKSELCLAIELMGKHSNVILYNYDTNVITGCAHNVGSEKSRERELRGLLPYAYPPKQKKKNLLRVTKESFEAQINPDDIARDAAEKFYYITVPLAQQALSLTKNKTPGEMYDVLKELFLESQPKPRICEDYSCFTYFDLPQTTEKQSVNDMISDYFSYHIRNFLINNLKKKVLHHTESKLSGLYAQKTNRSEVIAKEEKAQAYKTKGDLIMTYLYKIKKGDKSARVFDFEGNEIEIPLDENKTPVENANRYYNLYRKTKTACEYARNMLKETEAQIMYFEEQKFFAENSTDIDELEALSGEENENSVKTPETKSFGNYEDFKGYRIYFGKNKIQNDYILSKISSGEDLWFHPLNFAGSHIILKVNNPKEAIPDEVILRAAQITKEHSSQKNNSKTCIIYTKRKYVKKATGKQAFVTYRNETEIVV